MQTSTPLSTVSPSRPLAPLDANKSSPSPAKPTPTRGAAGANMNINGVTPTRNMNNNMRSPQCMSPGANSPGMAAYQAGECACPTCQYYKACYMYTQEAHSPEMAMASYQMYQYGYYPFNANTGMSPMSNHGGSQPDGYSYGGGGNHMSQPRGMSFSPTPSHSHGGHNNSQQNHHGYSQSYGSSSSNNNHQASTYNGNYNQNMMNSMNHNGMSQNNMLPTLPMMPSMMQPMPFPNMMEESLPNHNGNHNHGNGNRSQSEGSMQRQQGGNPVVEQFAQSIGSLAKMACSANGRTMLQGVMRLQHLDKIQTIFDELIADADNVMLDSHGCHVIRSLIEVIDEHQLTKLTEALHSKLILNMCTLSQYTRKILQTLFERHRSLNLQSIVDIMSTNAQYLAATQQGCISLMRVFERCTAEQKHSLAQPLMKSFADLACDPFGNYVVQCALEHSEPLVATRYAMDCFQGEFLRLATNKFGSNVCEKLIRVGNQNLRRLILDELIFNPAALQEAANNGFGNFVIQTLVETCNSPTELKKVCDRLRPTIAASPYGHKIDAKIRAKRFPGQQAPVPAQAGQKHALAAPMAAF